MNRENKVGMALGVLLIGLVAALFFRTEHDRSAYGKRQELPFGGEPSTPPLLPHPPFQANVPPDGSGGLSQSEYDLPAPFQTQQDLNPPSANGYEFSAEHRNQASPNVPLPPIPSENMTGGQSGSVSSSVQHFSEPQINTNDPIRYQSPISHSPVVPHHQPHSPRDQEGTQRESAKASQTSEFQNQSPSILNGNQQAFEHATGNKARFYQVKPGDTLSDIALKQLGQSSRYLDIYNANRDFMSSPDDLHIGMLLRLPSTDGVYQAEHQTLELPASDALPLPEVRKSIPGSQFGPPSQSSPLPSRTYKSLAPPPRVMDRRSSQLHWNQQSLGESRSENVSQFRKHSRIVRVPQSLYQVQRGDNLDRIALKFYGDSRYSQQIYEANKDRISHPDRVPIGVAIRLPEITNSRSRH